MEAIQCLRNARVLARWVLTLYVLTIGVAIAAPLFHDDPLTLLCSAAGGVKLVQVDTDDADTPSTETHLLDCVMCLTGTLPPETARIAVFLDTCWCLLCPSFFLLSELSCAVERLATHARVSEHARPRRQCSWRHIPSHPLLEVALYIKTLVFCEARTRIWR